MSDIPPLSQSPDAVRLTQKEAIAMADLHTRLRSSQDGPNLQEMAQLLGISEYEARALLLQVRQDQAPPPYAPPTMAAHQPTSQTFLMGRKENAVAFRGLGFAVALMFIGFALLLFLGTASVRVQAGPPRLPEEIGSPTMPVEVSEVPTQPVVRGD